MTTTLARLFELTRNSREFASILADGLADWLRRKT